MRIFENVIKTQTQQSTSKIGMDTGSTETFTWSVAHRTLLALILYVSYSHFRRGVFIPVQDLFLAPWQLAITQIL